MATIPPDTHVTMRDSGLAYPPTADATLVVAVHPGGMKVPQVKLTTVVALSAAGAVSWVGSVDEALLEASNVNAGTSQARAALRSILLSGPRLWKVVRPGQLRSVEQQDTVYQGDRPWIVLGEAGSCGLLAAPLNDRGNEGLRPYQCEVQAVELDFAGAKDSKLELNHLWSFPSTVPEVGDVVKSARTKIEAAVRKEFSVYQRAAADGAARRR